MHSKRVRLRSPKTRMSRTLLRRTIPSPHSRLLSLRPVKSQPVFLAAGTGALSNLLFTIPYCHGALILNSMRPLDCLHCLHIRTIFSIFFQSLFSGLFSLCLEYGSDFFFFFRSWFYGLRCFDPATRLRRRGYFRIFSCHFVSCQDTPSALSGNFLSFVYWLWFWRMHIEDNEFTTTHTSTSFTPT